MQLRNHFKLARVKIKGDGSSVPKEVTIENGDFYSQSKYVFNCRRFTKRRWTNDASISAFVPIIIEGDAYLCTMGKRLISVLLTCGSYPGPKFNALEKTYWAKTS